MADNFTFKDSTGATQTCRSTDNSGIHTTHTIIAKTNGTGINVGQTTMVESFPVVLPSDQTAIPITDNGGSLTVDGSVTVTGSAAVTIVDGGDVTLGAKADSAASSDTGTFTLMSLVKRLLSVTIGSITETAPATDTASSGLNGRLQRIAQRLTTSIGYLSDIDTYIQAGNNSLSSIDSSTINIDTNTSNIAGYNSDISSVLGDTTDAATTTDTTGTIKSAMRGLVKWAYERMPASLGQKTMIASLPTTIASDQTAIPVSGSITVTPDITTTTVTSATVTGAYSTGDSIATIMTFTNAMGGLDGKIKSLILSSTAGTVFDAYAIIFESNPTASTFTDNAVVVIPATDLDKIVGIVKIVVADFASFSSSSACSYQLEYPCDAKTCYIGIMAGATAPNFGVGSSTLHVTIGTNDY